MTMTIMMIRTDICHLHLLLRPQCLKCLISLILLLFYSEISKLCHCNQKHNDNFAVRVISLSLPMPYHLEPFKWYGVNLIPAWISNYVHYKVKWIYSFPNFSATIKLLEWVSNFIPHFVMDVITYICVTRPQWGEFIGPALTYVIMVKISGREPRTKCNKMLLSQEYDHSYDSFLLHIKGKFLKSSPVRNSLLHISEKF